jgi:hypothetical protein
MTSPYKALPVEGWENKTRQLIKKHPLDPDEIVEVVMKVWGDIFLSDIGSKPFRIGSDLFPQPQIMGFLLHELIPLEFSFRYPEQWRREESSDDKDMVYIPDPYYSIEIKTSSSAKNIFGNRSYAQKTSVSKKSKSGYYLAVNFQKFTPKNRKPSITKIRFGWLDHTDWIGQTAASGQQARLSSEVEQFKLIDLSLK